MNDERELMLFINGEYKYHKLLSWKCNLGRALWYVNSDIKEALQFVLEKSEELGDKEYKPTELNDPLMWEILLFYCQPEKVDISFFRERGIDKQNSLVRRTMWSVVTCLLKLNEYYMKRDRERKDRRSEASRAKFQELANEYYTKLTFEYAYELETLGLWHWAIFVVLHLENTAQKTKYIKDLLLKHAHSEEHIGFLINDCKIPTHYINEAKAIYFSSKGLYAKSFHQWLCGEFYQNAHDLLISQMILSSESLSEKFKDLEIVMDKLEQNKDFISNWDSQGKVIHDFLNLRRDTTAYFKDFFDQYGEFKTTVDLHRVQNINDSVRRLVYTFNIVYISLTKSNIIWSSFEHQVYLYIVQ